MNVNRFLFFIVAVVCCITEVEGRTSGAPICPSTAAAIIPGHGTQQTLNAGHLSFTINYSSNPTVAAKKFLPGDQFIITVTSSDITQPFKGFFIAGYDALSGNRVGSFSSSLTSGVQFVQACTTPNNAVTHTDGSKTKVSVFATWTAPTISPPQNLIFQATIVDSFTLPYYIIASSILQLDFNPTAKPAATMATLVSVGPTLLGFTWVTPQNTGPAITNFNLILTPTNPAGTSLPSVNISATPPLSYQFTSLSPSTTYSLIVSAINTNGYGNYSTPVYGSTTSTTMIAPVLSSAPFVINATSSTVALSWNAATSGYPVSDYLVQYAVDTTIVQFSNGVDIVATAGTTVYVGVINGLTPSTSYIFRVVAHSLFGDTTSKVVYNGTTAVVNSCNGCSGNGVCQGGTSCLCNLGYGGSTCSITLQRICPGVGTYCFSLGKDDSSAYITLEAPTQGWAAAMFGGDGGMLNGDTYVGYYSISGVTVDDRWSKSKQMPTLDTSLGDTNNAGTNNAIPLFGYQNASHTVIHFSRPLIATDALYDIPLTFAGSLIVSLAFSADNTNNFGYHLANRQVVTLTFVNGLISSTSSINVNADTIHAAAMFSAFAVLFPFGALTAWFRRNEIDQKSGYLRLSVSTIAPYIHFSCQLLAFCLSTFGFGYIVYYKGFFLATQTKHGIFGLVLYSLLCVQVVLGMRSASFDAALDKSKGAVEHARTSIIAKEERSSFKNAHRTIGKIVILSGLIIQVPLGFALYFPAGNPFSNYYIAYVVFLIMLVLSIETGFTTARLLEIGNLKDWQAEKKSLAEGGTLLKSKTAPKYNLGLWFTMLGSFQRMQGRMSMDIAKKVASNVVKFWVAGAIFLGCLVPGLLNLNIDYDVRGIYLPSTDNTSSVTSFVNSNFYQTETSANVVILYKNDGSNIVTADILLDMVRLEQHFINMKVDVTTTVINSTGTYLIPKTITFADVCSTDYPGARCNVHSPLAFWSYNADLITKNKDNLFSFLNAPIHSEDLFLPLNVEDLFGGIVRDVNGNITSISHMKFIYYTTALNIVGGTTVTNNNALAWQAAVLTLLNQWPQDLYQFVGVSDTSWISEAFRAITSNFSYFALCMVSMICFSIILVSRPHPIHSRLFIALGGGVTAVLAVLAGFAAGGYLGIPVTAVNALLPFLAVGSNIKDTFVILVALKREVAELKIKRDEAALSGTLFQYKPHHIIGRVMYIAGPSLYIGCFSNIAVFFVGSLSTLPVIQSFGLYAALCSLFGYLFQLTFFVSIVVSTVKREMENKVDFLTCFEFHEKDAPNRNINSFKMRRTGGKTSLYESYTERSCIESIYLHTLTFRPCKAFVLISFVLGAIVLILKAQVIQIGFDPYDVIRDISYVRRFDSTEIQHFAGGMNGMVIVTKDVKYESECIQSKLYALIQEFNSHNKVYNLPDLISWYEILLSQTPHEYLVPVLVNGKWVPVIQEDQFYPVLYQALQGSTQGSKLASFFVLSTNYADCVAGSGCRILASMMLGQIPMAHQAGLYTWIKNGVNIVNSYGDDVQANLQAASYSPYLALSDLQTFLLPHLYLKYGTVLAVVTLVGFISLSGLRSFFVSSLVLLVAAETVGIMSYLNMTLDALAVLSLVMSVGISFEFIVPLIHAYTHQLRTYDSEERMEKALRQLGFSNIYGAFVMECGLFFFYGLGVPMFRHMFMVFSCVICLSVVHGFIFAPAAVTFFPNFFPGVPEGYITSEIPDDLDDATIQIDFALATEMEMSTLQINPLLAPVESIALKERNIKKSPKKAETESQKSVNGYAGEGKHTPKMTMIHNFCRLIHFALFLFVIFSWWSSVYYISNLQTAPTVVTTNTLTASIRATAAPQTFQYEARVENFTVPTGHETLYYCSAYELDPTITYMVTEGGPLQTPGHEANYHHGLIFGCETKPSQIGTTWQCPDFTIMRTCPNMLFAFGRGSPPFQLPENVGRMVGRGTGLNYVIVQIHYDIPDLTGWENDSMGIYMKLVPQLLPIKAYSLIVTVPFESTILPPQQKIITQTSSIPISTCFAQGGISMSNNITVYGVALHAHRLAVSMWIEVHRLLPGETYADINSFPAFPPQYNKTGKRITMVQVLNSIPNYNFDLQGVNHVIPNFVLTPNDILIAYCQYSTMSTTVTVLGGESTSQEMCLQILSFFPAPTQTTPGCYTASEMLTSTQFPLTGSQYLSQTASQITLSANPANIILPKGQQFITVSSAIPINSCLAEQGLINFSQNLTVNSAIHYGGVFATSMWTEIHRLKASQTPADINSLYDATGKRNVTRVGPILGQNLLYNYQNPIWVQNTPFEIMPTDYIVVYCQYSTAAAPFTVVGGNGTDFTELCIASLGFSGSPLNNGHSTECLTGTNVFNSTQFPQATTYLQMVSIATPKTN